MISFQQHIGASSLQSTLLELESFIKQPLEWCSFLIELDDECFLDKRYAYEEKS